MPPWTPGPRRGFRPRAVHPRFAIRKFPLRNTRRQAPRFVAMLFLIRERFQPARSHLIPEIMRYQFVQNYAFHRIEFILPGSSFQNSRRVGITRVPSHPDALRAEIDVLGVTLVFESRSQQRHDMHAGNAAVTGQIAHLRGGADLLGHKSN